MFQSIPADAGRWAALLLLAVALGCESERLDPPRFSAVLFIADGMGPSFVTAARVTRAGAAGELNLDRLPHTALLKTFSADRIVTDSSAAATAMASGQLTNNGAVGQDATSIPGHQAGQPLENLSEWAAARGIAVGVVTNTSVTDGTPAAFYAHHHNRNDEQLIAQQALASRLDLLLGGGAEFFPSEAPAEWRVVRSIDALQAIRPETPGRVLGLFAEDDLPRGWPLPAKRPATLAQMALWALERLRSSDRPFFLVVESGLIDHAAHDGLTRTTVQEVLEMDGLIGEVMARLDRRTLLLVASDHETGGLTISGYPTHAQGLWSAGGCQPYPFLGFMTGPGSDPAKDCEPDQDLRPAGFDMSSGAHTGTDVILYGGGRGSDEVRGTLDHRDVYRLLKRQLESNRQER